VLLRASLLHIVRYGKDRDGQAQQGGILIPLRNLDA